MCFLPPEERRLFCELGKAQTCKTSSNFAVRVRRAVRVVPWQRAGRYGGSLPRIRCEPAEAAARVGRRARAHATLAAGGQRSHALGAWLYSGAWQWCVFTGYSLGAAEATIGALFNEADPSATALYLSLLFEPAALLRYWLSVSVWVCGGVCYLADTLLWYQIVMGLWGGVAGLQQYGVHSPERVARRGNSGATSKPARTWREKQT